MGSTTTPGNKAATEAERELREIINLWVTAVQNEDLEAIRRMHDPGVLMFDVPPPFLSRGLEDYMKTWTTFFAAAARPISFNLRDIEVVAGNEVAFATAIGNCVYIPPDEDPVKIEFRLTMGFRKLDSRWRIVHEHHSVPSPA